MKAPLILLALSMGLGLPAAHAGQTFPSSDANGIQLAQGIEIGPGGVRIAPHHPYDRSYDEDRYRRNGRGYDEYGRMCRTFTTRETDDEGREVTKRIRRCG
jgi:hypothetical protein